MTLSNEQVCHIHRQSVLQGSRPNKNAWYNPVAQLYPNLSWCIGTAVFGYTLKIHVMDELVRAKWNVTGEWYTLGYEKMTQKVWLIMYVVCVALFVNFSVINTDRNCEHR